MIRIVYVELSKLQEVLKKPVDTMTDFEKWAIFFRYANVPKYRKIVNEIIDTKEALGVASELLMSVSQDEHERAVFRSRRMAETDRMSDLATAEDRGKRIGREEGREEGIGIGYEKRNKEIVQKMLSLGRLISEIKVVTSLSEEEIKKLFP